jgi:branched-chain amino acid transport system ATP-binding protein
MRPILEVDNLSMVFGGLHALADLSMAVNQGEIVALIGPNGAGKSTLFNCVTGIYPPTRGSMHLFTRQGVKVRLNGFKPNRVTEKGIARTFQNIRLFQNMTVLENVMIGRHCRMRAGIAGAVLRDPRTRKEEQQVVNESYAILEKFDLSFYVNHYAKNLPYGAQRRLEIARAMATEPLILLLDEPAAGMNAAETAQLDQTIGWLRDEEGVAVLLVEHDMKLVMSLADRIYVLDYGRLIAQGAPSQVGRNPEVIKAYLGEEMDA